MPVSPVSRREFIIRPRAPWFDLGLRELLEHHELFLMLIWRDIKVRYSQTIIGIAWAAIQPLFNMVLFSIVFGHFAKIPSEGYPYDLFCLAALLPWTFFATGVQTASTSMISQQGLITKVYFPRLLIPASALGSAFVDMLVTSALYMVWLGYYLTTNRVEMPTWHLLLLPVAMLLNVLVTLGASMICSAVIMRFRDFRFVLPFVIQALMFISPVIYPVTLAPKEYQWILGLNPIAGIIHFHRFCLLGKDYANWALIMVSALLGLLVFIIGLFLFKRTESRFADIV